MKQKYPIHGRPPNRYAIRPDGVTWDENAGKWLAAIDAHGVLMYCGLYKTKHEAKEMYERCRKKVVDE